MAAPQPRYYESQLRTRMLSPRNQIVDVFLLKCGASSNLSAAWSYVSDVYSSAGHGPGSVEFSGRSKLDQRQDRDCEEMDYRW